MNWIKKWICFFFRHDYFLIKKLSSVTRKIGCRRCGETFGMHDEVRCVIPWDDELENLDKELSNE